MIALFLAMAVGDAHTLEGRYALSLHTVSRTRLPFLGWTTSETISDVLVDIVDRAGVPWQRQRACAVRVVGKGAHVLVPDAFVESLPVKEVAIELTANDAGATRYRVDLGVDDVGFDARRSNGAVPERADDPSVIDSDGDGKPGATIRIEAPVLGAAELYIVQRGSMSLDGTLLASGGASGGVELGPVEQHTIGASNKLLVSSPRIEPVSEESWFRLEPVRADAACQDTSFPTDRSSP